jgi:hypothetical protein
VLDPDKQDLSSKGHFTKTFFFCFWYFYAKMNKLKGCSHSKSNFRLKSTHPTVEGTKLAVFVFIEVSVRDWQGLATLAHKYGTQAVKKQNTEKSAKKSRNLNKLGLI